MSFQQTVARWVNVSYRHPIRILCALVLMTAVTFPIARQIRLDTDLKKLLPDTYPRVEKMDEVIAKVGDTGYFSVVAEHDDGDTAIRFIVETAEYLKTTDYVRMIYYRNPVEFLQENRFLLLPLDTLRRIRNYLEKKKHAMNPFFLDLEKSDTKNQDELDMDSVKERYDTLDTMREYHVSDDGHIVAMQVRPRGSVTDLAFLRNMYQVLVDETARLKKERGYPDDMQVYVSGSLRNKIDEYDMIIGDITQSTIISVAMILLILLVFFRNPLAIIVLFVPLTAGLCWTFAVTTLTIGFLNTITAGLFMVLFGLGVDHGIHLLKRYVHEVEAGKSSLEAMQRTMAQTGHATLISALTTAAGFFLMLVTDFKGFSHLGFISGLAMLFAIAAYFIGFPAFVALVDRRRWLSRRLFGSLGHSLWPRIAATLAPISTRWGRGITIVLLCGGVVAGYHLEFNYDFDTLTGVIIKSKEAKDKQAKVYTESLTPAAVLFSPDESTFDQMIEELRRRKEADTESPTIGKLASIRNFAPSDQDARLEEIDASAKQVTPLLLEEVDDERLKDILIDLRDRDPPTKTTEADVPTQIREYFTPQDGSDDRMLFIFPSVERRQGKNAIAFADDMYPMTIHGREYIPTGDSLIFADMLRVVVSQGLWIFGLSILAITLMLFVQYRRIRDTWHTLLSLLLGLALMSIFLHITRLQVNFYNMVIFAAIVGMGIDAGIHLYSHWIHERSMERSLSLLGGPITASMLTTMAGYSGMITSTHNGLKSIGLLAVIGLSACGIAALTVYPMYLRYLERQ